MLKFIVTALGMKLRGKLGRANDMKQSSETAGRVAFCRAWESQKPPEARLCYDPLAEHMIRDEVKPFLLSPEGRNFFLKKIAKPYNLGIMDYIPLRTHVMDDHLLDCLPKGLRQLVILGAGYDSRAYRLDELKGKVKIFEVDNPGTQEDKKAKLTSHFGQLPNHVTYVALDFEKDDLSASLDQAGFDPSLSTLFIWEGVTYFLDAQAVDHTLGYVSANTPAGSSIVFDYVRPEVVDGSTQNPVMQSMMAYCNEIGEPYKFGLEPGEVEWFLTQRGFKDVVNLTVENCLAQYVKPAHGSRNPMTEYSIAWASVA
jgi:methyltransferase (TIGR00027 family)